MSKQEAKREIERLRAAYLFQMRQNGNTVFHLTTLDCAEWSTRSQTIGRLGDLHYKIFNEMESLWYKKGGVRKRQRDKHMKALRILTNAAAYVAVTVPTVTRSGYVMKAPGVVAQQVIKQAYTERY
jgi:hypothetical protein